MVDIGERPRAFGLHCDLTVGEAPSQKHLEDEVCCKLEHDVIEPQGARIWIYSFLGRKRRES